MTSFPSWGFSYHFNSNAKTQNSAKRVSLYDCYKEEAGGENKKTGKLAQSSKIKAKEVFLFFSNLDICHIWEIFHTQRQHGYLEKCDQAVPGAEFLATRLVPVRIVMFEVSLYRASPPDRKGPQVWHWAFSPWILSIIFSLITLHEVLNIPSG